MTTWPENVIRKLDWSPNHDPRSLNFRAVAPGATSRRKSRRWNLRNPKLDQGEEGACVGHGVINACSTPHMRIELPNPQQTAFGMYYGSRYIDEEPGEDYDGTSVKAGCKLAVTMGFARGYRWCIGADDVKYTLLEEGPVVFGIYYYNSMFEPDEHGVVEYDQSSGIAGGHCMCATAYYSNLHVGSYVGEALRARQSWGDFGDNGDIIIKWPDFRDLLSQDGEAAILDPVLR